MSSVCESKVFRELYECFYCERGRSDCCVCLCFRTSWNCVSLPTDQRFLSGIVIVRGAFCHGRFLTQDFAGCYADWQEAWPKSIPCSRVHMIQRISHWSVEWIIVCESTLHKPRTCRRPWKHNLRGFWESWTKPPLGCSSSMYIYIYIYTASQQMQWHATFWYFWKWFSPWNEDMIGSPWMAGSWGGKEKKAERWVYGP